MSKNEKSPWVRLDERVRKLAEVCNVIGEATDKLNDALKLMEGLRKLDLGDDLLDVANVEATLESSFNAADDAGSEISMAYFEITGEDL